MRISVLGFSDGLGGGPTHFRLLTQFLAAEGHEVLAFGLTDDHRYLPAGSARARVYGIPFRGRGGKAWRSALAALRLRRFRPHLFVTIGYGYLFSTLARVAGSGTFRCYQDVFFAERDPVRVAMAAAFDAVAVQSPLMLAQHEAIMGPAKAINWLPCFADVPAGGHLAAARAEGEPLRLAYFGRLAPNKGLRILVQAMKDVPATLHLYGTGPEQPALAQQIAELGLGERVELKGAYPAGEAYGRLLAGYHALVLPSTYGEGLPLVLLEAMSCGLPFLSTRVGAIPDAADHPDAVLAEPEAAAIAAGLQTLCAKLARREFSPARLRAHFEAHFSAEVFAVRWRTMLASPRAFFSPVA